MLDEFHVGHPGYSGAAGTNRGRLPATTCHTPCRQRRAARLETRWMCTRLIRTRLCHTADSPPPPARPSTPQNPGLREAIKSYSQWPTIPQLYIEGEFVGGADIVEQMVGGGRGGLRQSVFLGKGGVGAPPFVGCSWVGGAGVVEEMVGRKGPRGWEALPLGGKGGGAGGSEGKEESALLAPCPPASPALAARLSPLPLLPNPTPNPGRHRRAPDHGPRRHGPELSSWPSRRPAASFDTPLSKKPRIAQLGRRPARTRVLPPPPAAAHFTPHTQPARGHAAAANSAVRPRACATCALQVIPYSVFAI